MADLSLETRPGYTGKLNQKILERISVIGKALDMPSLADKFPHLKVTDGSWRSAKLGEDVNLAQFIDHTVLKADASENDIRKLCQEAKDNAFYSVCVNGCYVPLAAELLKGSQTRVACVAGFPLGQMTTTMKAAEAKESVANGALDVDMVLNLGALKDGRFKLVYDDILAVVEACGPHVTTKVIFETCLLSQDQIIDAAIISVAAGASFIKTSTGFSTGGATPEAIDIMLAVAGNQALVKASGGVRDRISALQYVKAGVRRIGTSSGIAIIGKN